jgi:hypothetical protein
MPEGTTIEVILYKPVPGTYPRVAAILKGEIMKKIAMLFVLMVTLMLAISACGSAPAPTPEVVVVKETVVVEVPGDAPTAEPAAAEPAAPQYAPACAAAASNCTAPEVTMGTNNYCNEKQVYAILTAPGNTSYESLDPAMKCVDQVHADGSLRITCWVPGKGLLAYDLKACNTDCAAPQLDMNSSQCQEGLGYDAANQCCAQPSSGGEAGCTTFTVNIGTCAYVD